MVFRDKKDGLPMPIIDVLNSGLKKLYINQIKKTIGAYSLESVVIFETLQNSIDAINKNDDVESGKVEIVFNLVENEVKIKDNGKGFPYNEEFVLLGGGDKSDDDESKGSIGVGLKVVMFSSKHFYIESVFKDVDGKKKIWTGVLSDGYKFSEPSYESSLTMETTSPQETEKECGTHIDYTFPDSDSIIRFLQNLDNKAQKVDDSIGKRKSEKFTKALEHTFRTLSYSADVLRFLGLGKKKIDIKVSLIYDATNIPLPLSEGNIGDVLREGNGEISISFENKFWDIGKLIENQKGKAGRPKLIESPLYDNQQDFGRLNKNYIWIKTFYSKDDFKKLLGNKFNEDSSTKYNTLFGKINGLYVAIGSLENLRKYFIEEPYQVISVNGTPSDHYLRQPTSEVTYSRDILLLLDLKAKLNYGKAHVQANDKRLIGIANDFYKDIYTSSLKRIAKKIVGEEEGGDSSADYLDASPETNITARNSLNIDSSFVKEPYDENALIAIFFDLLGRGKLKGYEFYSLHGKLKYDGKAIVVPPAREVPKPLNDSDLLIVEFKLNLSALVKELDDFKKYLKQMRLLIVWEDDFSADEEYAGDYEVIPIENSKDRDRGYDGVKKCLRDRTDGTERQLFVVKEFIEPLSRPQSQ